MRAKSIFIAVCLCLTASFSIWAGPKESKDGGKRSVIVLGEELAPKDSTKVKRFKNHLIAPKGEWQCGVSVMYTDFSSSNSEYMLLLQGVNANASMLKLAPEASYTFANNHAIGARFQYTNIHGMVDAATLDLLGNLSLSIDNVVASSKVTSGSIYQRSYVGLDGHGRVGLYWDYILGYSRSKTQFTVGNPTDAYSIKKKVHLGLAPGIVYFPMNNLSLQVGICVIDFSYNSVTAYKEGQKVGSNNSWKAIASLNIMDLYFGLTIHL